MNPIVNTAVTCLFSLFVLAVVVGFFKLPSFRGWLGELAAGLSAKLFAPKLRADRFRGVLSVAPLPDV